MQEIKLPAVETEIRVAKEMKAGNKTIYTVIKVSILKTEDGMVMGSWLTPLAMLIVEPGRQFALSITGEKMPLEMILELAPSLKAIVDKAREIHRIKVT
jgi:hypothetical protein